MSEDEEQSSSSGESLSGPSSPVDRRPNAADNSDDDSDSGDEGSAKDGSGTESSTDDDDGAEGGVKGGSGSSSESSHDNSRTDDEENSGSSRSGSPTASRSSRSRSASENSENDTKTGDETDIKKLWETDPDLFGIRRSSRQKDCDSKPPTLQPQVQKSAKSIKKLTPKKRKLSSDEDESSDEEVTRTVRKRGAQVVSYKEDDSEDEEMSEDEEQRREDKPEEPEEQFETIERIMDHRIGKKGATGSATTVYAVEERGDPNVTLAGSGENIEDERQFLIKWTGWSHLHNTWESLDTLTEMKAKGLKKLDNYCKKEDEVARWKARANPEDIEYYECQLELQQELAKSYCRAERVIAEHKGADGQAEYYVKWECLPYGEATWENGTLIQKRFPEVIQLFKKRDGSGKIPSSSNKVLRTRPKFTAIKSQPSFMGRGTTLELRDYQLNGLNWLVHSWCKDNSVILADEMGLGKTIQTICFLSYLFETYSLYGPFILVVPLSTMAAWQREFAQWAPQFNVVTYLGDVASREIIREYEWFTKTSRRTKFNALLTTYEIVLKDKDLLRSLNWAGLIVDEAHRLKNNDSLLYKTLTEFDTNHRLLVTGTPLQNSLKELWSLLHFIMPTKFGDWESFQQEHENAATVGYAKLHKQLEPYILRRVKKDVEKSLPAKVEQILRVEMTSIQKQYYKWILTKNFTALRKALKGSQSTFVNVIMELKKCCNHAQLIKPIENPGGDTVTTLIKGSGKLMLLDKLLVRLKETGHRVLIFSQMVRMLDIIGEYLQLRRFSFQRLDGSIKGDLRKQALDHFNAEGSTDFCFLLSTRAGGLGINLATADTVIIFDSDWNPQNDLQAQARAHRIGQKNQVNIYRLVTKNSVEEDIVERAKRKMVLDHLVIQRMDTTGRTVLDKGGKTGTPFNKDELNAILKFGAEELFKEDENEGEDNCDIDEILRRAETHEGCTEQPGDELLSAFKVASFAVNEEEDIEPLPAAYSEKFEGKEWDQIIPEDLRKKVEEEEKEKEMADLFLPPRSRTTVRENDENKEALVTVKKARKRRRRDESEESGSDAEGRPKKRGRKPKVFGGDNSIKGFTDNQIRKFIRSFKRFPKPLLRIETIARDAELSEKSLADLKKLGEMLYQRCLEAMAEARANPVPPLQEDTSTQDSCAAGTPVNKRRGPREKGPIFKISGVPVNARTLSNSLTELEPLGEAVPKDESARKDWKFEFRTKNAGFDVDWGPEDDTRLLLGVWEHGTGSWDVIRESDPVLKEKVFLEGDKKPQLKNIQCRAEYLIRVLKKNMLISSSPPKVRKNKRADKKKENQENIAVPGVPNSVTPAADVPATVETVKGENDPNAKTKTKRTGGGRKKKDTGPMHFTAAAEPTSLNVLGDLDPVIFNECKEKMRPVKKALKALDKCDPTLSEKDQIKQTRNCLIQIGDQIQVCLREITDPVQFKQSKTNLWYFVSKFTEYDATKLYKLYKRATRKEQEKKEGKEKGEKSKSEKGRDKEKVKDKHKKSSKKDRPDRDRSREHERNHNRESNNSRERSKYPVGGDVRERERNFDRERPNHHREWDRAPGDPRSRDYREYDRSPPDPRMERAPGDPRERMMADPRDRDRDRLPPVDPRDRERDPRDNDRSGYARHMDRDRSDRNWADRNPRSRPGQSWGPGPPRNRWNPPPPPPSTHYGGPQRRDNVPPPPPSPLPSQPYYSGRI